jgi:hypothetical protein
MQTRRRDRGREWVREGEIGRERERCRGEIRRERDRETDERSNGEGELRTCGDGAPILHGSPLGHRWVVWSDGGRSRGGFRSTQRPKSMDRWLEPIFGVQRARFRCVIQGSDFRRVKTGFFFGRMIFWRLRRFFFAA